MSSRSAFSLVTTRRSTDWERFATAKRVGKESRQITVGVALKSTIKKITVKYEPNTEDRVTLLVLAKKD